MAILTKDNFSGVYLTTSGSWPDNITKVIGGWNESQGNEFGG